MRHAYLIMAHNHFDQLQTLLTLLDDPRNDIFLHIDARVDRATIPQFHAQYSQIITVPPMSVAWGGYSQIQCELRLLRNAVHTSDSYRYFHLISGADLPITSQDAIHEFFAQHDGKEFVAYVYEADNDGTMDKWKERIAYYHPLQERMGRRSTVIAKPLTLAQKVLHINRLKSAPFTRIGKGSQWFSITRDFAQYLVDHQSLMDDAFHATYCPDEIAVQTMLLNSPYAKNRFLGNEQIPLAQANMRLIEWDGGTPHVFTNQDYDELMSSPMLFARKFDESVDKAIIERVASAVRGV